VRETVGIFQYERLGMQRYEGIKITVFLIWLQWMHFIVPAQLLIFQVSSNEKQWRRNYLWSWCLQICWRYIRNFTVYQEQVMPVPKTNFSKGDADAFCEKRWGKNKRCLDKMKQIY
jgi:hypothetical protein